MGFIARLLGLGAILTVSYFMVIFAVSSIESLRAALGFWAGSESHVASGMVSLVSLAAVLTFFTVPAVLAMFGHASAWLGRVVPKVAPTLGACLAAVVLLDFGSGAITAAVAERSPALVLESTFLGAVLAVLVLGLVSRGTLLKAAESAAGLALGLPPRLFAARTPESTASVELRLAPTRRLRGKQEEAVIRDESSRFQRLAHGLSSLGCTTEFALIFRERRGRILLLARGRRPKEELERGLLSIAKAYLPESRPALVEEADAPEGHGPSFLLSGAPEPAPNPLEPLARFFLENGYDGRYSVVLRSHRANPVSGFVARRGQRRLARAAGEQTSTVSFGGGQRTKTVQDHFSQMEQERASKEVERSSSSQAVEAWVYVSAPGPQKETAERAAEVLRSALSSRRGSQELKPHRLRRPLKALAPQGRPTVLLPEEASPFLWIPQMAMGTEVAPSAEFELPPPMEGELELGEVVTLSGRSGHMAKVRLDDLARHAFFTGMTGSGKTTSCFSLLIQLHELGVPFLVVEPVKTEYRSLASVIRGLQVFTLGDEDTAPFRLNIFEPPAGVKVQTHLENLEAAWRSSFTLYSPAQYMVKEILFRAYQACGWDVKGNRRGRPITLADMQVQAEKAARSSPYEEKIRMDVEGQLVTRIRSLAFGSRGDMLDAVSSTPVETILRRPTVLELKEVSVEDEKAFVASLVMSNIAEHLEASGLSKGLKHLTLIEEAHRLLPNVSTEKGDPEAVDARRAMVARFGNMLAEVRAYGEGLAIVEQVPTKIIPDAIKNTAVKVVHRLPARDDREVVAGAMGMTEEQSQVLTALEAGEAVVHVPGHPLPLRVSVPDRASRRGVRVGEMSDGQVKELMLEFYLKNPVPRAPERLLEGRIREIIDSDWFKLRFVTCHNEMLRTGRPDALADLVTEAARRVSRDEGELLSNVERTIRLGAEFYLSLDERDRARLPREVIREMERVRRGRGG